MSDDAAGPERGHHMSIVRRLVMPTSDTLRYGVIGTGLMGVEHIENLAACPDATLTAIADPHEPSRQRALATWVGDSPVREFGDHRALLDSGLCDAVIVATPNHTHIDVLTDVLPSALPVLVEKPLCITVDDCRRVATAAANRDALVWVALEYRYMPPIARLIAEVGAGTVGTLRMLSIREHRFPFLPKVGDWNRFNRYTGGTLVEKCCHFFDLMNLIIASAPVRVLASGGQDVNHLDERYEGAAPDVADNAYVIVEYASGARALLDLCMFAEATHNQEEVVAVGDAGKVEALLPEGAVRIGRRGEHFIGAVEHVAVTEDRIARAGHHFGASYLQLLELNQAIRDGGEPAVTAADGLLAVAIGVAAHRAIDEARPVPIDEVL